MLQVWIPRFNWALLNLKRDLSSFGLRHVMFAQNALIYILQGKSVACRKIFREAAFSNAVTFISCSCVLISELTIHVSVALANILYK